MRFHQVREIVSWAVAFHGQLAQQFSTRAKTCEGERVHMALSHLADQEHQLQAGLARYLAADNEHRHVLDTWFSELIELPHPEVLEQLCAGLTCTTLDRVLASALSIHKTLETLYSHRAQVASIDAEQAFFSALASAHEAQARRLVRDMARLDAY